MKKLLLFGFVLILGLAIVTQAQFRGVTSNKPSDKTIVLPDLLPGNQASTFVTPRPNHLKSANAVTVLTLGTGANNVGWGYNSQSYDHLWADNDLKAIVQIHRMGPGGTPPSLSGYLGMDHAANYGATLADWSINYQVYAATLNTGGTYYLDAARFPQGAIYNPAGNTDPNNAYFVFFAPNLSAEATTWGGYSYGRGKWGTQSDSTKHLDWYSPPPSRYIPDSYTVTALGKAYLVDKSKAFDPTYHYDDALYIESSTWNNTTHDFAYTPSLLPAVANLGQEPVWEKVRSDPSGNTVWIAMIGNNGLGSPVFDSTFYPIFYHSTDGGETWSSPISVTIDGTTGIPAILNYISDARLETVYAPSSVPPRDQIPYTCAFEGGFTVDKWGQPHLLVTVAMPGGGFSIVSPDGANSPKFDSTMAIFDIYGIKPATAGGEWTWCARMMGIPKRFRCDATYQGATGYYIDQRLCMSRDAAGDKIFATWIDTWSATSTTNDRPDVFARGWDLVTNKLTNNAGQDAGVNVTYLSDVTLAAFCADQAQTVFTKVDGSSQIPIVCSTFDGYEITNPAVYKYISDFSFPTSAFTINASGQPWGSPCNFPVGISEPVAAATMTATVYPNPVNGFATVKVTVPQSGTGTLQVTNLVGQTVMSVTRNFVKDVNTFTLDATQLTSGVYFYTVKQGNQKVTGKIIVE